MRLFRSRDGGPAGRRRALSLAPILIVGAMIAALFIAPAYAHPEDDFCEVGAGLDLELCRQLAAANSADAGDFRPLLDEDGNVRSPLTTFALYLKIGVHHILPGGLDHILFVLALFLACERVRSLVIQISAFTVAHTATLGLAAAGVFQPPGEIVEPLIALSIAYVAIENIYFRDSSKWRPLIVFVFGLFHGLGFAGFIRDVGLPSEQFWSSLVGFNAGVEIGQLAVVAGATVIALLIRPVLARSGLAYRTCVVAPASMVIAATGLWWTAGRVFGL